MENGFGRRNSKFLSPDELAEKPIVTIPILKRIFGYIKPYLFKMALVLILILVSSYMRLLPVVFTGKIIDEGLIRNDLNALIRFIGLSIAVTLGANLIGVLESYLNTWIAQNLTFNLRNEMFRHLQSMSHRFFTENNQGDIITRMTSDISGVQQIMTGTLTGIISNLITLIVAIVTMARINIPMTIVGLLLIPLFIFPAKIVGKTRWGLTREAQEGQDKINTILSETMSVSGQLLVKLHNKEDFELERYCTANKRMTDLNIKETMAGRWFRVAIGTFSSVGPMAIYLVGGILMIRNGENITVGDITILVALLGRIDKPANSLLGLQVDWIRSMALFNRIFQYLDIKPEVENHVNPIIPERIEGNINFKNVSFGYSEDRPIIQNLNFSVEKGKSVAIVGRSGAGKSTIVNLIPRLYDATVGIIELDGINLKELDLGFLRSNIGMVTQDTYLFNSTIKDNLLYANKNATFEEIVEACKKADIHDFIVNTTDGYDTIVGNRGLKLSGGEKQRLSIARVLLKKPSIIIFDEATSSLDSISESNIQREIMSLISNRTSLIIAHRLSTILSADEIIVVNEGRIAERGSHFELLSKGGLYTELYETQFKINEEIDGIAG
ncbi:MAG: ABC transporter ATP-binding protein [Clostridiaceae bacterium]